MKLIIEQLIQRALNQLQNTQLIPKNLIFELKIDRSKDKIHGDFATNIALTLANKCGLSPRHLAEILVKALPSHEQIAQVEIAGPGFINFYVEETNRLQIIATVLAEGDRFGSCDVGQGQRVILEFVSANPTGPLHVGHGRSAAFGATLANLLSVAGFDVNREYYVNDAGRQMDILAVSTWLRYLELANEPVVFPANGYQGEYVQLMARDLRAQYPSDFVFSWPMVCKGLPADEPQGGDKERYIDAMILTAKRLLGLDGFAIFHQHALNTVLQDIHDDLAEFGVTFDTWFSERSLLDDQSIERGIEALQKSGHTYDQAGALWFRATDFGDEKDRVLVRANGQTTYFASDVAYHWNKYNRGFKRVIDIFGADHHGYITRLSSAVAALGQDEQALDVLLVQFAILYRGQQRVQMSTRSGSFVTLRELREEVGLDAARFFYVMRRPEQHMDFDLDLAKSQSNDNPVYYIQYAHARICSILTQLQQRNLSWDEHQGLSSTKLLTDPHEIDLSTMLSRYPEMIQVAAKSCEPHQIAYYLRDLAHGLHSYYNAVQLLCEDEALRCARLSLLKAVRQVLRNGLQILGVSAPEKM